MGKYFFCHQAPITRFKEACFPSFSELCKNRPRKHCTIPWEKRSRESVLWVSIAISVVTLTRWNCTVRWLPRKKWQVPWFLKKAQILDQRCCYEEKNEPRCFSISIEAAIFQLSQEENTAFANGPQCPGSEKHDSLQFLCKDTTRTHCTILWERRSRESVLWMLNPITVVTQNK